MSARTSTRTALKAVPKSDTAAAAVLDARQKALKVMANALYGFTGAQVRLAGNNVQSATKGSLHVVQSAQIL